MAGNTKKWSAGKALYVGSTDPTYIPGKNVLDDFVYDGLACINGPLVVGTGPNPAPPHVLPGAIESALVNILPRVPTLDNSLAETIVNGLTSIINGDYVGLTEAIEEIAADVSGNVVGTAQNITALRISSDGFGLLPFPGIGLEISAPINNVIGGWAVEGFSNVLGFQYMEGIRNDFGFMFKEGFTLNADAAWTTALDGVATGSLLAQIKSLVA